MLKKGIIRCKIIGNFKKKRKFFRYALYANKPNCNFVKGKFVRLKYDKIYAKAFILRF